LVFAITSLAESVEETAFEEVFVGETALTIDDFIWVSRSARSSASRDD
jgi:hypothetical protein